MRDLSGALAVMEADVPPMEDAAKALPTAEPSGKSWIGRPSRSIGDTRRCHRIFRESSDEPLPFMDIELHQALVPHFQQERLASFFIRNIGAFHDLVYFERLLTKRAQDIFSIVRHDFAPPTVLNQLRHDLVDLRAGGERLHSAYRQMTCVYLQN
jgi:hypothetical protein